MMARESEVFAHILWLVEMMKANEKEARIVLKALPKSKEIRDIMRKPLKPWVSLFYCLRVNRTNSW